MNKFQHIFLSAAIIVLLYIKIKMFHDYSNIVNRPAPICEAPGTSLVFLKNHKCASTTVERIFLRYGIKNGLTFALPKRGNRIGIPAKFNSKMLFNETKTKNNKYDLFVLHSRLNIKEINKVVTSNAKWFTIVREPNEQFESMWEFYDLEKFSKMTLNEYVKQSPMKLERLRKHGIWGIHQMFFDLGYGSFYKLNDSYIITQIDLLIKQFDLIMLAERMDESLILLKDIMCWKIEDIAYLNINMRKPSLNKPKISDATKAKLDSLNHPDILLYKYAKSVFQKKVENFGLQKMETEVHQLKLASKKLSDDCINGTVSAKGRKGFESENRYILTYILKKYSNKCLNLVKYQPSFINDIREKQKIWTKSNWKLNLVDL